LSFYRQPSFHQCSVVVIVIIIIIIIIIIITITIIIIIADLSLEIAGINRVWKFSVLIGADFVTGQ